MTRNRIMRRPFVLGLIDAALGNKEQAQREARRAVELLPIEKDAINGALMIKYSAMIAAWVAARISLANNLPSPFATTVS